MGRGRAKAKQAKVARKLKYQSGGTDLEALQRELSVGQSEEAVVDDDPDTPDDLEPVAGDRDEDEQAAAERR
jgi:hypothetical protein